MGSSPNLLRAKEMVYSECQVIPGSRKKSHIACNHEAAIPSWLWRGCPVPSSKFSFPAPAALCGRQAGRLWQSISRRCLRRNLTFLPGPWQVFIIYPINQFGDDPNNQKKMVRRRRTDLALMGGWVRYSVSFHQRPGGSRRRTPDRILSGCRAPRKPGRSG